MAGTVTHYYFAKDLYDRFDLKTKNSIKKYKDTLYMFTQGPDTLLFTIYNRNRKYGKISSYIHKNNTHDYFMNIIKYIKHNNLKNNYEIMAFLYGFIAHYMLDTNLHPYVIYKAGKFDKKNKDTYVNNCKHNFIEQYIDSYYINKYEEIPSNKYKAHKYLFNNHLSKELNNLIDIVYYDIYGINNMSKLYKHGKRNMKILYRLMRYDPTTIKYHIYKFIDKITPKTWFRFTPISYVCKLDNNDYILNTNNKKWIHPLNKRIISNKSVLEIYNDTLDKTIDMINKLNKCIYDNKDIKTIDKLFTNLSMSSGYDAKITSDYKYFE